MNKFYLKDLIKFLKTNNINFEVFDPLELLDKFIVYNIFTDTRDVLNQVEEDKPKEYCTKENRNSIFIAIKGEKFDSHLKLKEIVQNCKIIFIEKTDFLTEDEDLISFCISNKIIAIKSNNNRIIMAFLYKFKYDSIDEKLNIFAITGTDGKTSMVAVLHLIFSSLFGLSASIGTLGVNLNGVKYDFKQTTPTTPEIKDIYFIFENLYKKGVKFIFIEATSIASVQKRLEGISFDNLSFTTMTSDHLDFHKTLENYYNAKIAFIKQLANSKKDIKTIIYNLDDLNVNLIKQELKKFDNIISFNYGYHKDSDFRVIETKYFNRLLNVKIEISEKILSYYNIPANKKIIEIDTNLIGKVNSYNIVHSVAQIFNYLIVHQKKDINEFFIYIEKTKKIYKSLCIPGRMERIDYNNNDIFIDYAHTSDSLKNAILTLKDAGYKKIFTIMGCGGDRDKTKRPAMGRIATELSDFVIITSDNPRNEEPDQIIKDILDGITKENYLVEIDRYEAIKKGLDLLNKTRDHGALLIAGKGHEDYQEIKGIKHHFSDKEVVQSLIKK